MKVKVVSWNVDKNFNKSELAKLPEVFDVPSCAAQDADDVIDYISGEVGVLPYEYEILK